MRIVDVREVKEDDASSRLELVETGLGWEVRITSKKKEANMWGIYVPFIVRQTQYMFEDEFTATRLFISIIENNQL